MSDTGTDGHLDPTESDPSADSLQDPVGMGVSSERPGSVRGADTEASVGSAPTHTEGETGVGHHTTEGVAPDEVESTRDFDPDRNPRHG
ncbi:hypothetical protein [Nocardioides marmoraquaticus]